jgi:hypothetical protein
MKKRGPVFDPETHTYKDGKLLYPAVSNPISMLSDYSSVPPEVLKASQHRGTGVHTLTEDYDNGKKLVRPEHRQYVGYLEGYKKFRKENPWEIVTVEEQVYHEDPRYAGRIDRIYKHPLGRPIADVKSSIRVSHTWDIQLAVYKRAYNWLHPKAPVDDRVVIQLNKQGFYNLVTEDKMIPYKDCLDIFDELLAEWHKQNAIDSVIARIKKEYPL